MDGERALVKAGKTDGWMDGRTGGRMNEGDGWSLANQATKLRLSKIRGYKIS